MPRAIKTAFWVVIFFLGAASSAAAAGKTILVYGDSLSAAYGIALDQGWVALLGKRLAAEGDDYSVVNASISGEITSGGLTRLPEALERYRPAILILELGANDGLRGLPLAQMKANLDAMIREAQRAGARVLLVGIRMPPNYGPEYTERFAATFADLARARRVALVPFLLEGFAAREELFQGDRMHPSAEAQPLMLENVWRPLAPLLGKKPRAR
ncbi:MAG TPA: arylesterase [Burkholderiales bacterium]|nr:arylesterase [Burkholderiales bacterium]